jgi:hypothetical protein
MASSGNFMTFNNLVFLNSYSASYSKLDTANLRGKATAGGWGRPGNFSFDSGKWYCEFYIYRRSGSSIGYVAVVDQYYPHIDAKYNDNRHRQPTVADYTVRYHGGGVTATTTTGIYNNQIGAVNESQTFASDQWQDGDVIAIALDLDSSPQTVQFYRNGSAKGNAENLNSSASGTWAFWGGSHNQTWFTMNAGQDSSFAGNKTAQGNADDNGFGDFYYSPPSGFLAPCAANLPTSTDIDPAETDDNHPSKQFNAITWTGNRSSNSTVNNITGVGFQPDLVWLKFTEQTYDWRLVDSSRGVTEALRSNQTTAEQTEANGLYQFGSDGFSVKGDNNYNYNGGAFIGYCWKANGGTTASNSDGAITSTVQANQAAGFSIVQWTANATSSVATTVGHGLSKAPEFVITKSRDSAGNWCVTHTGLSSTSHMLFLNSSGAQTDKSGNGSMSANTSTVFSVNATDGSNSPNTDAMIAYCWHSVDGYSKFGTYFGTADATGQFIYTGFRPRLLFIKNTESSSPWGVYDAKRPGVNDCDLGAWDETTAFPGNVGAYPLDILSNGFRLRTANTTVNSQHTWVWGAWGDVPAKYNNAF